MMKLFHGSNMVVTQPDLTRSKPYKDFGQGFYLSADRQQALEMAQQKVTQQMQGNPVVNEFLFDETVLQSEQYKVKIFSDYSEEWALFVLKNRSRNIPQPSHDYDIVYGPIADDGVTYQLRRYQGGVISLQRLIKELRYAKGITFQYFFATEKALKTLTAL